MNRRVSEDSWTNEERREVLNVFLERIDECEKSPLFDGVDIENPNGGFNMKMIASFVPGSDLPFISLEIDHHDLPVYDEAIRLLRPLILSGEDVFLPKIVRHLSFLLNQEKKGIEKNLIEYIESFVSFEKEYKPLFFSVFIDDLNEGTSVAASSSEIALAYIYGRSVKVDIEKRKLLKYFESEDAHSIEMALQSYLIHLMRLACTARHEIRAWDKAGFFMVPIEQIDSKN